MIDWRFVAVHFTWILGLSILLATLSYEQWRRSVAAGGAFAVTRGTRAIAALGVLLVALGNAFIIRWGIPVRVLCLALVVWCVVEIAQLARRPGA